MVAKLAPLFADGRDRAPDISQWGCEHEARRTLYREMLYMFFLAPKAAHVARVGGDGVLNSCWWQAPAQSHSWEQG